MRIACGSEESERPLSRFPRGGKAGAGGFPPQEGLPPPLCIPSLPFSVDALYDVNRTFHLLIKPDNLTCYQHPSM